MLDTVQKHSVFFQDSEKSLLLDKLGEWFSELENCLIAYSGGVDSSLLALIARKVLGEKAVAVMSISPGIHRSETAHAKKMSEEIGIKLILVEQDDLGTEGYVSNLVNRCYFCRSNLGKAIDPVANSLGFTTKVDGTHLDDMKSPRPGVKALREAGFRAPFVELGLGKSDIRAIAHLVNLSNADRPGESCLSSRIAFGQKIDRATLAMVVSAEEIVRKATDARIVRVRVLGTKALIEVDKNSIHRAFERYKDLNMHLKEIGFSDVEISPEGYVSGRMLDLFVRGELQ